MRLPSTFGWNRVALLFLWWVGAQALASPLDDLPLPTYPGAVHTRIGGGGRLAYFVTGDSLEKVAVHFSRLWRSQGYPSFREGNARDGWVVSAFSTRDGLHWAVVLRTHHGKTLGFCVVKDLHAPPARAPASPVFLPEGSLSADGLLPQQGQGQWQSSALVLQQLPALMEQLEAQMRDKGYVRARASADIPVEGLEFARGELRLQVRLSELAPGLVVVEQRGWKEGGTR